MTKAFDALIERLDSQRQKRSGALLSLRPLEIETLLEGIRDQKEELENGSQVLDRLMALLKGVAIALKGPEPELVMHDWSDLPELAEKASTVIPKLQDALGEAHDMIEELMPRDLEARGKIEMLFKKQREIMTQRLWTKPK